MTEKQFAIFYYSLSIVLVITVVILMKLNIIN